MFAAELPAHPLLFAAAGLAPRDSSVLTAFASPALAAKSSAVLPPADRASKFRPARASKLTQLQWPLAAAHTSGVCTGGGEWAQLSNTRERGWRERAGTASHHRYCGRITAGALLSHFCPVPAALAHPSVLVLHGSGGGICHQQALHHRAVPLGSRQLQGKRMQKGWLKMARHAGGHMGFGWHWLHSLGGCRIAKGMGSTHTPAAVGPYDGSSHQQHSHAAA